MKQTVLFLTMLLLTCPGFAQTRNLKIVKAPTENPTGEVRKAVVIGMSDYGAGRSLDNTLNDADDMAEVFTRLGFEVTLLKNNDLRTLSGHLSAWYQSMGQNDMAVFYFAGHGIEVDGQNYLVPIDADMSSQADVKFTTLNVNQVLDNMEEKGVAMKLLILDACRDNPFKRSWNQARGSNTQGLAGMSAPEGTYIAFAASPGSMAQDGGQYNLRNGVFTHFIIQEIVKAGATIDEIFNKVTGGVSNLTNRKQTPFKNSSLTASFYFIPPHSDNPPTVNPTPSSNNPADNPTPSRKDNPADNPTPAPAVNVTELVIQAHGHYMNKRFNDAIPLYRQAAELGHANAQHNLGLCYEKGYGVTQDYDQALLWYRKAAEQGDADSQNSIGYLHEFGLGVPTNITEAFRWYNKAAENGNTKAKERISKVQDIGFYRKKVENYYNCLNLNNYSYIYELFAPKVNRLYNIKTVIGRDRVEKEAINYAKTYPIQQYEIIDFKIVESNGDNIVINATTRYHLKKSENQPEKTGTTKEVIVFDKNSQIIEMYNNNTP